jgi:hypothetical protein
MIARQFSLAGLVAGLAVTSCELTLSASPVPVEGGQEELSKVSGQWTGRYWSKATGRHGTR